MVFKTKLTAERDIDSYKLRLGSKGFSQLENVDFKKLFFPVVKDTTIKKDLSVVVSSKWGTRKLDVKNAFLHGNT